MPIVHTNQFWDYIINEPLSIINKAKEFLIKEDYDYQTKEKKFATYYQTVSKIEIDSVFYETIRFPGGLYNWLANNLGISIDYKKFTFQEYEENDIIEHCQEMTKINPTFEIRNYQVDAVLTSLNDFRSLIYSGVGSGKTSILAIVCRILMNENKILILNDNNFILQQIYDRLISFNINNVSWEKSSEPDYSKQIIIKSTAGSASRLSRKDEK